MNAVVAPAADIAAISLTGRMLGMLFYYEPDTTELSELYHNLQQDTWVNEWPCGTKPELAQIAELMRNGLNPTEREALSDSYQQLFIGPNALAAPPWGSVYLDRESVLFGDSTLALRQWQATLGIAVEQQYQEPEDHIGLLLLLAAWLAEQQPEQLTELLATHLLPWSGRYLALLEEHAAHPFYLGLAQLTRITLDDWQQRLNPLVVRKELFF